MGEGQWEIMQCENLVIDGDPQISRSNFKCIIAAQRKMMFYGVNFSILYCLTSLSFLCTWIPTNSYSDRLQARVGFLFTTMAWKQTVEGWIPQKPYLTLMDWYVLIAFAAQVAGVVCTWFEFEPDETNNPHESGAGWKIWKTLSEIDNCTMKFWLLYGVVVVVRTSTRFTIYPAKSWYEVYYENQGRAKMKIYWSQDDEEHGPSKEQPTKWWTAMMGRKEECFDKPRRLAAESAVPNQPSSEQTAGKKIRLIS